MFCRYGLVYWVEELYIRCKFSKNGLGSEFLDFIEREFRGKARRLRLELCESNNEAKSLYLQKGYKTLKYLQMVKDVN